MLRNEAHRTGWIAKVRFVPQHTLWAMVNAERSAPLVGNWAMRQHAGGRSRHDRGAQSLFTTSGTIAGDHFSIGCAEERSAPGGVDRKGVLRSSAHPMGQGLWRVR